MITPRGNVWYTDFRIAGQRVRISTGKEDRIEALEVATAMHKRMKATGNVKMPSIKEAVDRMFREKWDRERDAKHKRYNANLIVQYFGEDLALSAIDYEKLCELQEHFVSEGNAAATVNRKMSVISAILRVAVKKWRVMDVLPPMPYRQRESEGRIRYLSDEEKRLIIKHTPSHRVDVRTLWLYLLDTGCRRSEALRAIWDDINFEDGTVQIYHTKNRKTRTVPLSKRVLINLKALRDDLAFDRPFPISDRMVTDHWNAVRTKMGLMEDKEFVVHALRHTCATDLLKHGADIRQVQVWLGHSTITQTMRYTKVVDQGLIDLRDLREDKL